MVPGYGVELWSIAKSHKQGAGEFELFKNWGVREEEDVTLWGKMDDNTKQMDCKFESLKFELTNGRQQFPTSGYKGLLGPNSNCNSYLGQLGHLKCVIESMGFLFAD